MRKKLSIVLACLLLTALFSASLFAAEWPAGGETGSIKVEGGKVFYRMYGKDKPGTPLIVLHGGPGASMAYFYTTAPIANDRPVVYFNQLGSPGSDIADTYKTAEDIKPLLTVKRYADEVDAVVKHFNFDEFSILGHSWGTMLAVEYVLEKKPANLKSLVLAGPFLNVDIWLTDAQRLIKSISPDMWTTIEECVAKNDFSGEEYKKINEIYSENFLCRNMPIFNSVPEEPKSRVVEGISVYEYMWGPSEFTCTGTLKGRDVTSRLGEIKVPVLYVTGEFDSGSPAASNYYNTLTPNGEVVIIKGAAHMSYLDNPNYFNFAVRSFLNKVDK